jgi:hypothetical protein
MNGSVNTLTLLALVVLEDLHGSETSATRKELVGELSLVVRLIALLVAVTTLV